MATIVRVRRIAYYIKVWLGSPLRISDLYCYPTRPQLVDRARNVHLVPDAHPSGYQIRLGTGEPSHTGGTSGDTGSH